MTVLWTVIVILAAVVVLDSVAIMALARQVGVLHLRVKPLRSTGVRYGPTIGEPLALDGLAEEITPGVERVVIAFVAPHCATCAALLPAFRTLATHLPATERLVMAGDVDHADLVTYLAGHGMALPVLTEPNALRGNNVPGTPFVAMVDSRRRVLAAGAVHNVEQIEFLLDAGRHEYRAYQLVIEPISRTGA